MTEPATASAARRRDDGPQGPRRLGLFGATLVGVGAIVGGGILALSGVAFAATGPSAILAFALNAVIAGMTALSFAELASRFPESGGTYVYAKKVLSVEAAFVVGWVVWFASLAAAVLYAMGFAVFAVTAAARLWPGEPPAWLGGRVFAIALAALATIVLGAQLARRRSGGGEWATIGKVVVFAVLLLGGAWSLGRLGVLEAGERLSPFFTHGGLGLLQAMGYSFIALQGFDLIAAVGGEVRDPKRNLPRAMLLSLGIAVAIYLPLLLFVSTVGLEPGETIGEVSRREPAIVVAVAAERFLGVTGWWLVVVAGLLSMLSALQANLFGASRVAQSMARDRTLPAAWARWSARGTPATAVLVTAAAIVLILLLVPSLSAAGAASSLIFLMSFALAHATAILARRRGAERRSEDRRSRWPLLPALGLVTCLGLAVFQGLAVRSAGALAGAWLLLGLVVYLLFLAPRARVVDASAEAHDPDLARLRGRSSLVLVPIANPASARGLVDLAGALAPSDADRVLLLSVVKPPAEWREGEPPRALVDAQAVLGESLTASFAASSRPEALVTIAPDPWLEIGRVARRHRCESLLVGLPNLPEGGLATSLEELLSDLDCSATVLRAPTGWRVDGVQRVLVPVGGRRDQSEVRARLLGHLRRAGARGIEYVCTVASSVSEASHRRVTAELERLAQDECGESASARTVRTDDPLGELGRLCGGADLVILGMQRLSGGRRRFGELVLGLARETSTPLLLVARRR